MSNNQPIFWIVEDIPDLATILTCQLMLALPSYYVIKTVHTCKDVKSSPYDIILCDQNGVDLDYLNTNGAFLITMSGDHNLKPTLVKPFAFKDLQSLINSAISNKAA